MSHHRTPAICIMQPIVAARRATQEPGLGWEVLACGHEGKHSPLPLIHHRIHASRTRRCQRCTATARRGKQQADCASKTRYQSATSATAAAQHWRLHAYPCAVCHAWHLTHRS